MWTAVVYLKSHGRRPVRLGATWGLRDTQAVLPAGWCDSCGREVYVRGQRLCRRCLEKEGAKCYEE